MLRYWYDYFYSRAEKFRIFQSLRVFSSSQVNPYFCAMAHRLSPGSTTQIIIFRKPSSIISQMFNTFTLSVLPSSEAGIANTLLLSISKTSSLNEELRSIPVIFQLLSTIGIFNDALPDLFMRTDASGKAGEVQFAFYPTLYTHFFHDP